MPRKKKTRRLAVIDFETDPFKFGRVPEPFCCEFYSDDRTEVFWGDDCAEQLAKFLEQLPEDYLIYAHNGGKFDFHFLHPYIDNPVLIIKTRIVKAALFHHELRDSFAILPVPLAAYEKVKFNYDKMERPVREKHKEEILVYLHSDCVSLFKLVSAFRERFGDQLTIGGTAMKEIKRLHQFQPVGRKHDETFRPFFYGGRVQCFSGGLLKGPWKCFDKNSMYPDVMRNYEHPVNGSFYQTDSLPDTFNKPFFAHFRGSNNNALPSRDEDGSLSFSKPYGDFWACSHELQVALEYGLVEIDEVYACHVATETISFIEFVDEHYAGKRAAKLRGDAIEELFEKLLLNSGYGRFAINPEHFADWIIHRDYGSELFLHLDGYKREAEFPDFELWSRPTQILDRNYCDVAIAASITSASRAELLIGLQQAIEPVYCDTDSIICRDFTGEIDDYKLGAWKLEKESDLLAIGGKKLYALYNAAHVETNGPTGMKDPSYKLSSKGGTLSLRDLIAVAGGSEVLYQNDAPTFSLTSSPRFIHRNFRRTLDNVA